MQPRSTPARQQRLLLRKRSHFASEQWAESIQESEVRFGAPPASAGRVLSRSDPFPSHGYGRFKSQSGESENRGVPVQHMRYATFAVQRRGRGRSPRGGQGSVLVPSAEGSPSAHATRPAEAGWHAGRSGGRVELQVMIATGWSWAENSHADTTREVCKAGSERWGRLARPSLQQMGTDGPLVLLVRLFIPASRPSWTDTRADGNQVKCEDSNDHKRQSPKELSSLPRR